MEPDRTWWVVPSWSFVAFFALTAAGWAAVLSLVNRVRRRHNALLQGLDRSDRAATVNRLRAHLAELKEHSLPFGGYATQAIDRLIAETRLALAELLLEDDAADEALAELEGARTRHLYGDALLRRSRAYFEAYLLLRRYGDAARALPREGYVGRFLAREGDARLCLAKRDPVAALAILGDAFDDETPPLQLVRARAWAALDRQPNDVERVLRAQSREALEKLIRRNAGEPAALVARRIIADAGPYR